ncbi:MAG: PIG-L deacetylase family protein [Actinomycetota bacterium]
MGRIAFRALAVSAHPDDVEFGCAGTLAAWVDQGAEVTICIVTDGSTGTQDRALLGDKLAEQRRQESEAAARIIGAAHVEWLGYRDGYVEYNLDLRKELARVFRRYRPHRYVVMDPSPTIEDRFVNHPDHRAVGQASLDVTLTAGTTPGHFPELLEDGLEPWRGLRELWIMGPGAKPVVADITSTLDRKIQALMAHASQVGSSSAEIAGWIRSRAEEEGARAGFRFGESFQVISQGPGFHAEDVPDDIEVDFAPPPVDPRSTPAGEPA